MVVVCDALVCRIACGIHENVTIKMVSNDDEIEKHFGQGLALLCKPVVHVVM